MTKSGDLVGRARTFATERHAGQTRKNRTRDPYITHPAKVAALVAGFGGSEGAIAAAWLHDTVEDCPPTSHQEIQALFGPEIATLVSELTDDKTLPKSERKRRQVLSAASKSPEGALIKLCDKLANVRDVGHDAPVNWTPGRRVAYLDWAEMVVAGLTDLPRAACEAFVQELCAARGRIGAA